MGPLVSVIIPVYNRLEYICEAIGSVLSQSYQNYEIVIVNDGSTVDVCRALVKVREKIRYVSHDKNKGLAATRNTGIKESQGKYIAFLDDDDLFEDRKLELQVQILENHPEVGLVYSDCFEYEGWKKDEMRLNPAVGRADPPGKFPGSFFVNPNVRVPTVLLRRECFDEVGMFDESLRQHEDGDLFLRVALKWQVHFLDYPSAKVRIHEKNMSRDRVEMYESMIRSWRNILTSHPEFKESLGRKACLTLGELHMRLGKEMLRGKLKRAFEVVQSGRRMVRKARGTERYNDKVEKN